MRFLYKILDGFCVSVLYNTFKSVARAPHGAGPLRAEKMHSAFAWPSAVFPLPFTYLVVEAKVPLHHVILHIIPERRHVLAEVELRVILL